VPVALLGLTDTATFASQKEFHKQLYQDTLPPWYELIQSEIELQLLPDFDKALDPDIYVEFNVEAKLRGSFEEQAALLTTAIGRPWMEVAEGRTRMNLPDRDDPTDHELAIPTNNVSLGPPAETDTTADPATGTPQLHAVPASAVPADRILRAKRVLDRQQHALLERLGRGEEFDFDRWKDSIIAALAAEEVSA